MTKHPKEQLSAYLDDELNHDEKQEVENHIEKCESCQALLEDLLDINHNLVQTFRQIQAPIDLEDWVLQLIGKEGDQANTSKGWLFAFLLGLLTLVVFYFITGAIIVKLIHGLSKLMITLVYVMSHFILSVPTLSGGTVVLSLIVLVTSFYSLRRLFQTTAS